MILDLFAGAGGWSEGLATLGLSDVGIELMPEACETRQAVGHTTIRADVTQPPIQMKPGIWDGLIASPPCQSFSRAGNRAGLDDARGRLVWQVPRYVDALRPRWVACEQVPDALGIWWSIAHTLRGWGYRTWTGVLCAADYGVPQTRNRAYLLARLDGPALPPEPTHAKHPGQDGLFGQSRLPWVSMAEALGWGMTKRPAVTVPAANTAGGGPRPLDGGSGARRTLREAQERGDWRMGDVVSSNGTVRDADQPAPTITGSADNGNFRWVYERPATTIVGSSRPDVLAAPARRKAGDGPRRNAPGSVRITVQEAAVLQGFRADYPWQGSRTKQFLQVGNAVCPPIAAAICATFYEAATLDGAA